MDCGLLSDSARQRRRCFHRCSRCSRAGVSLLEAVVTIAVLGVLATVVGLARRTGARPAAADPTPASAVSAARLQALESGRPVTISVRVGGEVLVLTVAPDGRIPGGDVLGFDPLSGRRAERSDGESTRRDLEAGERANRRE